jgi:hypothetical protein
MSRKNGARTAQPQDDATRRAKDAERKRRAYWADAEKARAKRRARRQRNLERERAQQRAKYWSDPDKHRAASRERARSERGRASNRRAVSKYRRTHPQVIAAQREAQKALLRGELRVSLICEAKGCHESKRLQLHHPDYRRPKEAVRVCHRCHEKSITAPGAPSSSNLAAGGSGREPPASRGESVMTVFGSGSQAE